MGKITCRCLVMMLSLLAAASAQGFEAVDAEDAAIDDVTSGTAATLPSPLRLPPFFAVRACLPYNLLITPSSSVNEANETDSGETDCDARLHL
ncbi:hypothetical protein DUNSADRAFT_1758 [Dunaliella salina]|uniref:Secreted protein n=1 Tax=Dunaliella salina TaxID=3046 RepID=A0ABQ7FX37_DUNSA|nr:hypothetical protein DUNSADRAFT_1758 [Dunaliella salina]|eukprot:KAF5826915.1 hypothetical protein DUNSADRAFT_1758 [Dunaliella salina]